MNKIKQIFEKNWPILVFVILAVPVMTFASIATVSGGVRVYRGSGDSVVTMNGTQVTLNTDSLAYDIFIPTNSQAEINSFLASDLYRQLSVSCTPQCKSEGLEGESCGEDDGCGGTCSCQKGLECDKDKGVCTASAGAES